MQIKTTIRYHLILVRMAAIKTPTNSKCWCGEKGTLLHCWWECKLVQPLWRRAWRFLKKLQIELSYEPAFFIVQLSHLYMTTGKSIALTRQTFVGKVMSLLFNMLSRLVITFLPVSKRLLISWLQSPSAVILEPKERKSLIVSIVSPSICHEVKGPDAKIFMF